MVGPWCVHGASMLGPWAIPRNYNGSKAISHINTASIVHRRCITAVDRSDCWSGFPHGVHSVTIDFP